ncbi:MarR family transcriptional regulator [Algoriphagus sp. 4150]|uniref:MarR family transcriptional regulator n=1 Tax=Algoriphagus sp. 4150 TaxID=2817756 RepID=UPI0038D3FDB4
MLTERQTDVLKLIVTVKKISTRKLAEQLEIAESAVQKHLKRLPQQGIIERIGTINGYWKILIKE